MPWLAVALGLGAAALFAVGAVAQQQEAAAVVGRGAGFVRGLLRRPRWWAATFGNGAGYVLQAAGLAAGSILVVQPLLVLALVFALPLGARWNARPVGRREIGWAWAIAIAVALFLVVGNPDGGHSATRFADWLPSLLGCGVVVAAGGAAALRPSPRLRSLGLAVIAGTLFGLASALTKSLMHFLGDGVGTALVHWETYSVVLTGLVGFLCQQLAFQAGSLEVSFPAAMVLDPVVSVVVGVAALQERLRAEGAAWTVIALAVVVMIAGTLVLARSGVPTPARAPARELRPG